MPTAPSYGARKIATAALPSARLSAVSTADTFGASAGDRIAKAGADLYEAERLKADEQAVYEARRSLNDWELVNIYDPKTGAIAKRGKDAFDLPERLTESYDKHVGEVLKGLSTDRQRIQYQRLAEARRQQTVEWAQKHVAVEREKFYTDQFNADIESSAERAARNPTLAAGEIAVQRQRTIDYFTDRGAPKEVIEQELQKRETATHARVVTGFLAGGAVNEAQGWLDRNRQRMDQDTVTQLELKLRPASDQARGISAADEIERKLGAGATYDQLREGVRTLTADNPNAYKVAMAEVEHRRTVREREALLVNRKNDQAVDGFMAKIYGSGRAPSVRELQQLPEFKAMDGTQQLQAVDRAQQITRALRAEARAAAAGTAEKTDYAAYASVLERIDSIGPAEIAAMRGLSGSDKRSLIGKAVERQSGQGSYQTGQAKSIFDTTFLAATDRKKVSDLPQGERERLGNLMSVFTTRLDEHAAGLPKGKKVTSEEMQRIADDMFLKVEYPDTGFLGMFKKQGFKGEALPGVAVQPKVVEKINEIPFGVRRQIATGLGQRGVTATDEKILEVYNSRFRPAPREPEPPPALNYRGR